VNVPAPRQQPHAPTSEQGDALAALRASVAGPVLTAGDPGLAAEAATFNVAITHTPAVVVGATCAEDVAAAVRYAAGAGLKVAVQATGHGPVQPLDGGLLVTTARMQGLAVDPVAATARIEAGVRWASVIEAAVPHGLAPLSGSSSGVGAVGYTLGGGVGPLARRFGFAADAVRSLEVVTADGAVRHVDESADPELFWALRGGKASFGIVTAMVVDLVPVARMYAGGIFFAGSAAAEVLHAYRRWVRELPEETTTSVAMLRLPPLPDLPEPLRGQFVVHLRFAHTGSTDEGERLLAPMRAAGPVLLDGVAEMPFAAVDAIHQDPKDPMPAWERGAQLLQLPAEAVETLLAVAGPGVELPLVMVELRHLGGALARQPRVPNAVAGRDGAFQLMVLGPMVPGLEQAVPAAGGSVLDAMAPWATGRSLLNFLGDATTPRQVATAWEPEVFGRLLAVKEAYDPADVFRGGHAIGAPADHRQPVN
jgi:FAD/FMN-containing dehydrogenase